MLVPEYVCAPACKAAGRRKGMAKKELIYTTRLTREDVAGVIEALIEGLKNGLLRVQKSDEMLELEVPRVVDLEVEAKIDDERAEFEIEVSWRTNRAENPDLPLEKESPDGTSPKTGAGKSAAGKGRKKSTAAKAQKIPLKSAAKTVKKVAGKAGRAGGKQPGK